MIETPRGKPHRKVEGLLSKIKPNAVLSPAIFSFRNLETQVEGNVKNSKLSKVKVGKSIFSQFGHEEKLDDGLKSQDTTGNSFRESVKEGQTVKVVKNVVGGKQFDIHNCPPIDEESLIINRVYVDKIDVEKIKKEDLENIGPRTDVEFPAKVDDAFYANGVGNVHYDDVAVHSKCEENDEEMDAEAENAVETDKDLKAMIKELKSRTKALVQNVKAFSNEEPLSQFKFNLPYCSSSAL